MARAEVFYHCLEPVLERVKCHKTSVEFLGRAGQEMFNSGVRHEVNFVAGQPNSPAEIRFFKICEVRVIKGPNFIQQGAAEHDACALCGEDGKRLS